MTAKEFTEMLHTVGGNGDGTRVHTWQERGKHHGTIHLDGSRDKYYCAGVVYQILKMTQVLAGHYIKVELSDHYSISVLPYK